MMINLQTHTTPVEGQVYLDGVWYLCVEADSITRFEAIRLLEHAQVHLIFHSMDSRSDWTLLWSTCCDFRKAMYTLLREIEDGAN